nr:hypothetical protein [Tanacetum cinerariifolium]
MSSKSSSLDSSSLKSSSQGSSSQQNKQNPQPLIAPSNVQFDYEDVNIAFNNSIALLESKIPLYKDMLLFLSNNCISKALTIQPSAIYTKYLREFWYITKVADDTITFSLLNIEKQLSFNRDIFSSIIGLDYTKDFVSLPTHEAVKDAIATLRLADDKRPTMTFVALAHSSPLRIKYFSPTRNVLMVYIVKCLGGNQGSHDQLNVNQYMIAYALCWGLNIDIARILFNDLIAKIFAGGKKRREKNVCYIRYLSIVMEHLRGEDYLNDDLKLMKPYQITNATFKDSKISEVPLTSHIRKVVKLPEKPLTLPFVKENVKGTDDKSLSETVVHPVSKPKAKADKKRRTKKILSSSEPNISQVRIPNPTTQAFESQLAEEIEHADDEFIDYRLKSIGDVTLESLNKPADEDPYDTESEIKLVKRFKLLADDDKPLITSLESMEENMEEDSDLASIPDDESEEKDADNVIDELAELKAFADKPSLLDLRNELNNLTTKVQNHESSISKQVTDKLEENVPDLIAETIEENLPDLLSKCLKNAIP